MKEQLKPLEGKEIDKVLRREVNAVLDPGTNCTNIRAGNKHLATIQHNAPYVIVPYGTQTGKIYDFLNCGVRGEGGEDIGPARLLFDRQLCCPWPVIISPSITDLTDDLMHVREDNHGLPKLIEFIGKYRKEKAEEIQNLGWWARRRAIKRLREASACIGTKDGRSPYQK